MIWTRRLVSLAAVAAVVYVLAVWAPSAATGDPAPIASTTTETQPPTRARLVDGHGAAWWAQRARRNGAVMRAERRTLLHTPTVKEALNLACTVYGSCATLWRRAGCETGGTFNPRAANKSSSARGLLQFLTTGRTRRFGDHVLVDGGTWATTPFWRFDVYSPYANALAAGWMIANGRGGEWACR